MQENLVPSLPLHKQRVVAHAGDSSNGEVEAGVDRHAWLRALEINLSYI